MEYITSCFVSFSEYLLITSSIELDILTRVLTAIGVAVLNAILIPLVKLIFKIIVNWLRSKQKTPENDGELADIVIDAIEQAEKEIDKLEVNNGANNKDN